MTKDVEQLIYFYIATNVVFLSWRVIMDMLVYKKNSHYDLVNQDRFRLLKELDECVSTNKALYNELITLKNKRKPPTAEAQAEES